MSALEPTEAHDLREAEQVIEEHYTAFLKVGLALAKIRDAKLYRQDHKTFAEYCEQRWNFTRTHAYRLIDAGEVGAALSPIGDIPETESQARALKPVLDEFGPAAAAKVMEEAKASGPVTAQSITDQATQLGYSKPTKVTHTETTKTEYTINPETGEILTGTPAALSPSRADSVPAAEVESSSDAAGAFPDPIAEAKKEAAADPGLLAFKAIERFDLALKTIDAAGGLDAIEKALAADGIQNDQLWLTTLDRTVGAASVWSANIRRRNLRSVK